MFVYNGQVTRHHSFSAAPHKIKHLVLIRGIQIIEKDPTNASCLPPVADVEVVVTPRIENNKTIVTVI